MNKRIICIIVLICFFAQAAWAQTWTEVNTKEALNSAIANGAHIRLTGNITLSAHLTIPTSTAVTIDLNGHTLSRNLSSAIEMGCVIIVAPEGSLTISGGTISGGWNSGYYNDGIHSAGGIVNKGTTTLNNVTISGCKGNDGGGIMNAENATLNITGGSITNCQSTAHGGGAIVNYSTATVNNCTISGNTAYSRGGAIWNKSSLTVSGSTLTNNTATNNDGGAIHLEGGTTTLTDVTITNNTSKDAGGIYVHSDATLNLGGTTGSTLSGNTSSEHGGGGIVNYGTVNLSGSVNITGNTCHTDGSGIWSNSTLRMQGNIQVKNNNNDDVYLKENKKINVNGAITSGAESIGIRTESLRPIFTINYSTSGTSTIPFFPSGTVSAISLHNNGECQLDVSYYECSWDSENKVLVHTLRTVSPDTPVANLCDGTTSNTLNGDEYWFVAYGTYHFEDGLTCTGSHVHIILMDDSEMSFGHEGLHVEPDTHLHIYCQSYGNRMGKLTAINTVDHAAIGATRNKFSGDISIHGGNIQAKSGVESAGIGGAYGSESGIKIINIYDGIIYAESTDDGAGIGYGDNNGDGHIDEIFRIGHINIYGGNITAQGGEDGAGIGDGEYAYYPNGDTNIDIFGGTILAMGGDRGAGIGSGCNYEHQNININGGFITAKGGKYAAGIGSGKQASCHIIRITGGTIYAYGGDYGAGIGSGQSGNGPTSLTISGGIVNAYGGTDAAGIGSGEDAFYPSAETGGGKITISGGTVYAEGKGYGAGIGVGEDAHGADIIITGGNVHAKAGSDAAAQNGCAFGREETSEDPGTLILGDNMMVHAGQTSGTATKFTAGERVNACLYRPYAHVEPCDHSEITYTLDEVTPEQHHVMHCRYCAYSPSTYHVFLEGSNICSVCGYHGEICTISIYLPVIDEGGNYTDGNYGSAAFTYYMVKTNVFFLPPAPTDYEPRGMAFKGWRHSNGNDTTFVASDDETLINENGSFIVFEDVDLTARYKKINLFGNDGNWNDTDKWFWNRIPPTDTVVFIDAAASIPSGYTAYADSIVIRDGGSLTIEDGGQLIHNNAGLFATVQKNIAGHDGSAENGWHFIASPMTNNIIPSLGNSFLTEDSTKYDLYYYEEPTHYWRNYKQSENSLNPHFSIEPEKGYLYANSIGTTLGMTGTLKRSDETVTISNLSHEASELTGWNLVGNPFACKATIDKPCYTLTGNAINTTANAANTYQIAPSEAVMVQADATSESVTFTRVVPATQSNQPNNGSLQIVLSQVVEPNSHFASLRGTKQSSGSGTLALDNTIVSFKEGERLEKFVFNPDLAKLYIPQDGKDYAITNAERQGEIPLNFEATENGEYTIFVNPENVEMAYLHLIDNLTGEDVDLLAPEPVEGPASYTFTAKTTDYASRFRLVFSTSENTDGDTAFAFISNGNLIVTGEGTLQIIDVLGRQLITRELQTSYLQLPTSFLPAGVYILRLINGEKVSTQKIVID